VYICVFVCASGNSSIAKYNLNRQQGGSEASF